MLAALNTWLTFPRMRRSKPSGATCAIAALKICQLEGSQKNAVGYEYGLPHNAFSDRGLAVGKWRPGPTLELIVCDGRLGQTGAFSPTIRRIGKQESTGPQNI
jgi:hypothetical protein